MMRGIGNRGSNGAHPCQRGELIDVLFNDCRANQTHLNRVLLVDTIFWFHTIALMLMF